MKFKETPQIGTEIKMGFVLMKIISKRIKQTGCKMYFMCLEKDGEKRLLYYNPSTKETGASFERYTPTFGGSSKGSFKSW